MWTMDRIWAPETFPLFTSFTLSPSDEKVEALMQGPMCLCHIRILFHLSRTDFFLGTQWTHTI